MRRCISGGDGVDPRFDACALAAVLPVRKVNEHELAE
jgi:hypothetical protein